jgi:hypothetical protein
MAIHWNHMLDFAHLNLARFSLLPAWMRNRSCTVPALKTRWPESYEKTALGYEASWAGVFQDLGKKKNRIPFNRTPLL